ncbi:MAG: alpha-amylase, partial [Pseudomonadota bacterium]|nr:alpha-amylase [Pseudomonadota bacterium]
MAKWQAHPVIYEINTWRWLHELGAGSSRAITLGSVPGEEWDKLAGLGIDAVWLMGVWERSPLGIRVANRDAKLRSEFARALPDLVEDD